MNTFLNRVDVERQILRLVNNVTRKKMQLTGLSLSAIEDWEIRNGVSEDHPVVVSLTNLSEICQILSSRSSENFKPFPKERMVSIQSAIENLRASLPLLENNQ